MRNLFLKLSISFFSFLLCACNTYALESYQRQVDREITLNPMTKRFHPEASVVDLNLEELKDVQLSSREDGEALVWDISAQKWVNRTVGAGVLGDLLERATAGNYTINKASDGVISLVRADPSSGGGGSGITVDEVTALIRDNVAAQALVGNTDPWGSSKVPEIPDVPLGYEYPVAEDLGSDARGYAVVIGRTALPNEITTLSKDLNLQMRGEKVLAIINQGAMTQVILDGVPSDTTAPDGYTYFQTGAFGGFAGKPIFRKTVTLVVGESLETIINELGIELEYQFKDTASEIKDKLETLTGDDRLDASAVKNLPSGGSTEETDTNDLPSASEVNFLRGNKNVPAGGRDDFSITAQSISGFIGYDADGGSGGSSLGSISKNIPDLGDIGYYSSSSSFRTRYVINYLGSKTPINLHIGNQSSPLTLNSGVYQTDTFRPAWTDGQVIENVNIEFSDGTFISQLTEATNTESKIPIEDVATNLRPHLNIPEATESLTDDQERALSELSVATSSQSGANIRLGESLGTIGYITQNLLTSSGTGLIGSLISPSSVTFKEFYMSSLRQYIMSFLSADDPNLTHLVVNGVNYPVTRNVGSNSVWYSTTRGQTSLVNNQEIIVNGIKQDSTALLGDTIVTDSVTLSNKFDVSQAQGLPEIPEASLLRDRFAIVTPANFSIFDGIGWYPTLGNTGSVSGNITDGDIKGIFSPTSSSGRSYTGVGSSGSTFISTLNVNSKTPKYVIIDGVSYDVATSGGLTNGREIINAPALVSGQAYEIQVVFDDGTLWVNPIIPEAQDVPLGFAYPKH